MISQERLTLIINEVFYLGQQIREAREAKKDTASIYEKFDDLQREVRLGMKLRERN